MAASQAIAKNKALVHRFVEELWNQGNLSIADEVLASDYVEHSATPGGAGKGKAPGPEGMKSFVKMFRHSFPDMRFTIEEMIAEGDKVAVRISGLGTHQGELMGLAPTGKQVRVAGAAIHRIVGDKIAESYEFVDRMGFREQLGVPDLGDITAEEESHEG